MVKAIDVADYVITLAHRQQHNVKLMQLQKIIYFLHASYLIDTQKPLIDDEPFHKLDYGPSIFTINDTYGSFGALAIDQPMLRQKITTDDHDYFHIEETTFNEADFIKQHPQEANFIQTHLIDFLLFTPRQLIQLSQLEPQWSQRDELEYYASNVYYDAFTFKFYQDERNQFWQKGTD